MFSLRQVRLDAPLGYSAARTGVDDMPVQTFTVRLSLEGEGFIDDLDEAMTPIEGVAITGRPAAADEGSTVTKGHHDVVITGLLMSIPYLGPLLRDVIARGTDRRMEVTIADGNGSTRSLLVATGGTSEAEFVAALQTAATALSDHPGRLR